MNKINQFILNHDFFQKCNDIVVKLKKQYNNEESVNDNRNKEKKINK